MCFILQRSCIAKSTFVVINKRFSVSGDWSPENHLAPYHFADVTRMPFAMFFWVVYLVRPPVAFLQFVLIFANVFWRKRCYVFVFDMHSMPRKDSRQT